MKFLIVLLAAVCVAQALPGGWNPQSAITQQVLDIARWSTNNLAEATNVAGTYTQLTIRNLQTQVVNGINYKFTLDVLLNTPDNKYVVSLHFQYLYTRKNNLR